MDDAVESHQSGLFLYWNLKKLQQYDVNMLYFAPLWFSRQEWAVSPSTFNIKAQGLAWFISLVEHAGSSTSSLNLKYRITS